MKLQGIYVAAATPFDYKGDIYRVKVQHNLEKWNRTSVSGYVFGGSAGEGPLLGEEELIELWKMASMWAGDRPVLAELTAEGVDSGARMACAAAEAGCKAIVCGVPSHYKNMLYGAETQKLFFRALGDRSPVPVVIRNAPSYTGVDLLPETAAELSHHPNIAGVIETGTPAGRIAQIKAAAEPGFQVLSGTAVGLWGALEEGASGAVLSLAGAVPYACITLWEAFRTREAEAGQDWQDRVSHPDILTRDLYGVPGLKFAMELNGYYGGPPRLPFCPMNASGKAEVETAFAELRG